LQCDETKPTCLQCQKSRRQCPGYKDDFDLVFRNETQATERRARRSINSKKIKLQTGQRRNDSDNGALASGSGSQGSLVNRTNAVSSGSVPGSVNIPIEIQAFHYFLSNYVLVPQAGTTRGHWIFVMPLLKGELAGTQLSTSFTAVALASFGNRPSAKHLLVRARQEYTKALNHVNRALANPAIQKSDQTLASILLLGLYEVCRYYLCQLISDPES
jgi:Fungal specific transcription factor domain